jgi:DNA-binding beta-propeller fold protein YncE
MFRHRITLMTAAVCVGAAICCPSCCTKSADYAAPESFIVDPATGIYYVSNVNWAKPETAEGVKPSREDNNGYITTLDKNLNVLKQKFVEGGRDGVKLNDPKGMVIVGNTLWVADLREVRAFDKTSGKNTANVSLEDQGAVFLNDIAAGPDGIIYVSDTEKNKIFSINTKEGNAVEVLVEGKELNGPNGLYWDADQNLLYVACWAGGAILTVNAEREIATFVSNPDKFAHLDGLDRDDAGNFYVSDYHKGIVYRITPELRIEIVVDKLSAPADISLDRANNRLLIPLMTANAITTHNLSKAE